MAHCSTAERASREIVRGSAGGLRGGRGGAGVTSELQLTAAVVGFKSWSICSSAKPTTYVLMGFRDAPSGIRQAIGDVLRRIEGARAGGGAGLVAVGPEIHVRLAVGEQDDRLLARRRTRAGTDRGAVRSRRTDWCAPAANDVGSLDASFQKKSSASRSMPAMGVAPNGRVATQDLLDVVRARSSASPCRCRSDCRN